jgi:hypothetical protein
MVDGLKDIPERLELVTLYALRCRECTWEWSLLGDRVSIIYK